MVRCAGVQRDGRQCGAPPMKASRTACGTPPTTRMRRGRPAGSAASSGSARRPWPAPMRSRGSPPSRTSDGCWRSSCSTCSGCVRPSPVAPWPLAWMTAATGCAVARTPPCHGGRRVHYSDTRAPDRRLLIGVHVEPDFGPRPGPHRWLHHPDAHDAASVWHLPDHADRAVRCGAVSGIPSPSAWAYRTVHVPPHPYGPRCQRDPGLARGFEGMTLRLLHGRGA